MIISSFSFGKEPLSSHEEISFQLLNAFDWRIRDDSR
jgi:hypothetical protein